MPRRVLSLAFLAVALSAAPAHAASQVTVIAGNDTVAVERWTEVPGHAEGSLLTPGAHTRTHWSLAYAPASASGPALAQRVALEVRGDAAPDTSAPRQKVACTFSGGEVAVEVGASSQTVPATAGAWPYLNPSFAMLAMRLRGVHPAAGEELALPLFLLSGGRSLAAGVRAGTGDTLLVTIAGIELRVVLDSHGRLLGGTVPAQGLRLACSEVASDAPAAAVGASSYAAPADAPYTAEDVTIAGPGGITLAGTLTVPKQRGIHPLFPSVLLLTGSGQQDRDEAIPMIPGYRPFRQIADVLARHHIASLRLDDRGVGGSGGDPTKSTTADFTEDARAAIAWLRHRPGFEPSLVAVLGHSEGGLEALMLAAGPLPPAAIVLMAAPSWNGRRVIEDQNRRVLARSAEVAPDDRPARLAQAMATVDSMGTRNPWLGYFLACDPLAYAKRAKVPALVLQGETDQQVDPKQASELASALRAAGAADVTLQTFPATDHLFLADPDGDPSGYPKLASHTIDGAILERIAGWLADRLK